MKNTCLLIIVSLSFFSFKGLSQESKLFIPVEHQKAIHKGSRNTDGTPGEGYFQNRADYVINVRFNPKTAKLEGNESVTYYNNSPDTLKNMVIRLYPNLFKPETVRQVPIDTGDYSKGVDIKSISINGKDIPANKFLYQGTNLIIPIPSGLSPSLSFKIKIDWSVDLPNKTLIRMGRYDTSTYFVAYWYPQIAVYDDISGWCTESYTGLYEFYNDYNNFDIKIEVPANCLIWATGDLQNGKDIFHPNIFSRIEKAKQSDTVIKVITNEDYKEEKILQKRTSPVWHFKANNVSDFAFGVSDSYIWDAVSVEVDSYTHRRALINSVYKKGTTAGEGVAEIGRYTILKLSTDLIGVPYPYPHNTIWEGHGGMEFPMMCNNGASDNSIHEVFVTSHEISHSYFPFMVGTNEIYYAWIDEGLITFIPKAVEMDYGNPNAHYYINSYNKYAMGSINDIPMAVPTTHLTQNTYFMQNYGRAAAGFYFLNDMLGKDTFKTVLKTFILRWESKHPTPTDLFFTLNSVTKQDWGWFWNPWFNTYAYADLALKNVVYKDNKLQLSIQNNGSLPVPIKIIITYEDNTTEIVYQTAKVWKDKKEWNYSQSFTKKIIKIKLGDRNIPDAFPDDNYYVIK